MKQIVVKKHYRHAQDLLPPYYMVKFLKLNGIQAYVYVEYYDKLGGYEVKRITFDNKNKNTFYDGISYYLDADFGEIININKINDNHFIETDLYFGNREDEDLIKIAKEINDEGIVKTIEIPENVKYQICSDDGGGEWLEEVHRTWY